MGFNINIEHKIISINGYQSMSEPLMILTNFPYTDYSVIISKCRCIEQQTPANQWLKCKKLTIINCEFDLSLVKWFDYSTLEVVKSKINIVNWELSAPNMITMFNNILPDQAKLSHIGEVEYIQISGCNWFEIDFSQSKVKDLIMTDITELTPGSELVKMELNPEMLKDIDFSCCPKLDSIELSQHNTDTIAVNGSFRTSFSLSESAWTKILKYVYQHNIPLIYNYHSQYCRSAIKSTYGQYHILDNGRVMFDSYRRNYPEMMNQV